MDKLPVELVSRIISYIPAQELAILQLVSRRFYAICRDNSVWRMLCYEADRNRFSYSHTLAGSITLESSSRSDDQGTNILNQQLAPRGDGGTALPSGDSEPAREKVVQPTARPIVQWDPSYEGEEVNWYSEYVARHAPLSMEWFQEPYSLENRSHGQRKISRQVKGMGILKDCSYGGSEKVLGPLDDGSICLWDLSRSTSATPGFRGGMARMSSPGVLFKDMSRPGGSVSPGIAMDFIGVGECVSVDSFSNKAYIAVGNLLNEVDLATFQLISQQRYAWSVFALSQETEYHTPLTVATTLSLNLYDSRSHSQTRSADCFIPESEVSHRISSPPPVDNCNFASLFQPGPLSVLHPPPPNINSIILAGRFPSILLYDRRYFPRLQGAVHSGARLCGSTAIPTSPRPYSNVNPEWQDSHTIVTCGEYKGRGSLELFTLSATPESDDWANAKTPSWGRKSVYQNRQSASRSKLLSVASHGTRLVYSDADGYIKWVERDGRTEVRRWNINQDPSYRSKPRSPRASSHGYPTRHQVEAFGAVDFRNGMESRHTDISAFEQQSNIEGDVIRKILPTGADDVPDNELLLWTGERIGRLRFSPRSEQIWDLENDFLPGAKSNSLNNKKDYSDRNAHTNRQHLAENRQYEVTVQNSLQAHRNELSWMGDFGTNS